MSPAHVSVRSESTTAHRKCIAMRWPFLLGGRCPRLPISESGRRIMRAGPSPLRSLFVERHDARAAEAEIMLQRVAHAFYLALACAATQLMGEFVALR